MRCGSLPAFAALICLCVAALGVSDARAQGGAGSSAADVSDADPPDDSLDVQGGDEDPSELDYDVPSPGAEVRVVVAGESEAAAAYAAGDSVTGFSAADVDALGALSVADLAGFTPNLEIVTTGSTTPTFFIRGVGLNDFNANASGAVAIFQDDVAINAPAMQLGALFDIENIAIFRGPVGKGAARNASAGAIRLYSRKPTGVYGGYLRSSLGNYDYNDFEGAIEAPIVEDVLLARFAFRSSYRDGYQKNGCGGKTSYPGQRTSSNNLPTDPRWSLCGENVVRRGRPSSLYPGGISTGFSPVPLGLPDYVNDLGSWATRLTLRYQPTLDMDWIINGHVANRDETSRQGISYGTRSPQIFPDGSRIDQLLGGADGTTGASGFIRPQVTAMQQQQQQILQALGMTRTDAANLSRNQVAAQIGSDLDFDPYTGYYNDPGETRNLVYGGYVRGEIALPASLQFTTVSGYDAYSRFLASDTDQSPNVLFEITTGDTGWQFYQNLQLDGYIESQALDWSVGAYYLQESLAVTTDNDFGDVSILAISFRDYTQDTYSWAAYADFSWPFWDDFTLDGGVRFNWEQKTIDYELISVNQLITDARTETNSSPTGEIRLTYNFRDDTHAYWKYTRGWKGGHFNASSPLRPEDGVTFAEPEDNNAYETGLRASILDNRVGMNFSLFYYDYDNFQLFTVQNTAGATPEFVVVNAQGVQVYGSEFELNTSPWDNTRLQARFSWLESSFTELVLRNTVIDRPVLGGPQIRRVQDLNFTGNRMVNSPQFKISLTAEHTVQLGRYGSLTGRYDTAWTDDVYFDPTEGRGIRDSKGFRSLPANTIGQHSYWLHNLLFIYRPPVGNFTIEAYVRNVTDEVYKSFAFDATVFQKTTVYFTGEPRMFGGTLSLTF